MIKKAMTVLMSLLTVSSLFIFSAPAAYAAESAASSGDEQSASDYKAYISEYEADENEATAFHINAESNMAVSGGASVYNTEDSGNVIKYNDENGFSDWEFVCSKSGWYNLYLTYMPLEGRGNSIEISVMLDGDYPYDELKDLILPRWFENATDGSVSGTQVIPNQKEIADWYTVAVKDSVGLINEPLMIYLSESEHTLRIIDNEEPFLLKAIELNRPEKTGSYNEISSHYGKSDATGFIKLEGEDAVLKTGASLVPKSDNTSASLSPASTSEELLNYIGSTNWQSPGETLIWKFNVAETGLYSFGLRYRQNYILNGISYRRLEIDGKLPFKEAGEIPFKYSPNWQYDTFSNENDEAYMFFLEKGEHTISLSVTMGPMADINYDLLNVTTELGTLYRKIVMITGENPDSERDYDLFLQINGMDETLEKAYKKLNDIAKQITDITGNRSDSNISVIKNMAAVIKRMRDKPYFAADYKSDYYNNYCSMSSIVYEMRKMALDIDEMNFYTADSKPSKTTAGAFKQFIFGCSRFFVSFIRDYSTFSDTNTQNKTELTLWVNWGRDQAQVLNNLISESFIAKYGIGVKVKVVNASMIQAVLSDNGPDLSLRLARSQPVNLAMRNALCDLSEFADYADVIKRFMNGAEVPYKYQNGVYALPDTQQFYMLFYRKDIFEELGIAVPKTWDEFLNAAAVINRSNMYVGVPYVSDSTQNTAGIGAVSLFPTVLLQSGGTVYSEDETKTMLSSPVSIRSFEFFTSLYTDYKFPVTYNFFNRFRSGEMPMAIAPYVQYTTLNVAAPEISGKWGIAAIPGVKNGDGSVNNCETGGGTGSVILKNSKHKSEAWEFLKWWTSAETQVKYSNNLESLLGAVERQATANTEALQRLSWSRDDTNTLIEQWKQVIEIPEVPGGYYAVRAVDQAFWSVYNNGKEAGDSLTSWSEIVDAEIKRKRTEYGLD